MTISLTTAELALQERARAFVDELCSLGSRGGDAPRDPRERAQGTQGGHAARPHLDQHVRAARRPRVQHVGPGPHPGTDRRVTNALGWVVSTGPSWIEDVATEHQIQTWIRPTVDGDIHECYAITEEGAGSDVDGIEATAGHEDDDYVLNGVKWHVTSANLAAYVFFQPKLVEGPNAGRHVLFFVDMGTPGVECIRVPEVFPHLWPPPLGDEVPPM